MSRSLCVGHWWTVTRGALNFWKLKPSRPCLPITVVSPRDTPGHAFDIFPNRCGDLSLVRGRVWLCRVRTTCPF